ncbi:hypothetical protein CLIB1444_01S18866 [[Candida] jaroonii]|uniref:Uncharacterized protein n=1 Tax=[Candida] jaroonii TaxID=467808 RepID=A0ACA9Y202_9ASCO|nr:hypothetical protein CLIB1444_01S18866 [[Candida] jaroonii]
MNKENEDPHQGNKTMPIMGSHRNSLKLNRRVSFAPEVTLHKFDFIPRRETIGYLPSHHSSDSFSDNVSDSVETVNETHSQPSETADVDKDEESDIEITESFTKVKLHSPRKFLSPSKYKIITSVGDDSDLDTLPKISIENIEEDMEFTEPIGFSEKVKDMEVGQVQRVEEDMEFTQPVNIQSNVEKVIEQVQESIDDEPEEMEFTQPVSLQAVTEEAGIRNVEEEMEFTQPISKNSVEHIESIPEEDEMEFTQPISKDQVMQSSQPVSQNEDMEFTQPVNSIQVAQPLQETSQEEMEFTQPVQIKDFVTPRTSMHSVSSKETTPHFPDVQIPIPQEFSNKRLSDFEEEKDYKLRKIEEEKQEKEREQIEQKRQRIEREQERHRIERQEREERQRIEREERHRIERQEREERQRKERQEREEKQRKEREEKQRQEREREQEKQRVEQERKDKENLINHVITSKIPLADITNESVDEIDDPNYTNVTLTQFLNDLGIQFLDDLQMNYYEKPSNVSTEDITFNDYVKGTGKLSIFSLLKFSNEEMAKSIEQGKTLFKELDESILTNNPKFFKDFYSSSEEEKSSMTTAFLLTKEFSRLKAKKIFCNWRIQLIEKLIMDLNTKIEDLTNDKVILLSNLTIINEEYNENFQKYELLNQRYLKLKAIEKAYNNYSLEERQEIKSQILEYKQDIINKNENIQQSTEKIKEIDDKILHQKSSIDHLKQEIIQKQKLMEDNKIYEINEIKSLNLKFKLLQKITSIEYLSKTDQFISFNFNDFKIEINFENNNEIRLSLLKNNYLNEWLSHIVIKQFNKITGLNFFDKCRKLKEIIDNVKKIDLDIYKISCKFPIINESNEDISFTIKYFKGAVKINVKIDIEGIDYSNVKVSVKSGETKVVEELKGCYRGNGLLESV